MRTALLTSGLLLALALVLAQPPESEALRGIRRRGARRRMDVTCSQVKPQEVCDGTNSGFQVSDGCNVCTCGGQAGKLTCSIKSCPREDELTDDRVKRRATRYCAKLARKVQKRLRRFQKKAAVTAAAAAAAAGSDGQQRWPIKCFKERKLCRDRPGVAFFDGCNRCRCPQEPASVAQCESANACPEFVGSRREFKRRCRTLGARIEGGGDGGGRRGGRRRQQRRPEEEAGGARSLVQRLLSRF